MTRNVLKLNTTTINNVSNCGSNKPIAKKVIKLKLKRMIWNSIWNSIGPIDDVPILLSFKYLSFEIPV
jgi:hypothetical protein